MFRKTSIVIAAVILGGVGLTAGVAKDGLHRRLIKSEDNNMVAAKAIDQTPQDGPGLGGGYILADGPGLGGGY